MNRTALVIASVVALAATASGQTPTTTWYLHKSGSPVGVPGGTTTFVIDENAPVASTPVAETVIVPKGTSQSFPTFIAPTFAAPTTLGLDLDAKIHVSANLSMNDCAIFQAVIQRVDNLGVRSFLAQGTLRTTVPQGGSGGTVGFGLRDITLSVGCDRPTEDVTIQAGESIAVTVNVTNVCKANRSVFLAYDSTTAPTAAMLGPTPPPDPVFTRACFAKCQLATSKATEKFFGAKNKCVTKCEQNYRKGVGTLSDCYAPYGGATLTCITDPLKGVEAKATSAIQKACNAPGRCPPCYNGGDCTGFSLDWVQNAEGQLDSFVPGIYCDGTTNTAVGKCMDNTGKVLWRYSASRAKCYDKCFANEIKGLIPAGSCDPEPTDPATSACQAAALSKAIPAINKLCADVGANPSCGPYPYPTGAEWSNLMSIAVDLNVPQLYCGGS
jgi:hypothetical protein